MKAALRVVKEREPEREVVIICEALFLGVLPMFLGAEMPRGLERVRSVGLSVTVPFVRSRDVPAFFVEEGREEGREEAWRTWEECTGGLKRLMEKRLREAGAVLEQGGLEGALLSGQNYTCHDVVLQLGVPSWFYRRSDWPEAFKFVGVLPPVEVTVGRWPNLPSWWEDVRGARQRGKKVVVVAQGTVEVDPNDLILPVLKAMADRSDVLIVAILGRKGGTLPEGVFPPANARITDYLHYDAVLPFADVWAHNGGYGAVQHGIAHGVPMVVAGEGMDKVENAKRVEHCGSGLNLGGPGPSTEDVRKAVGLVLDDDRYHHVAALLRNESMGLSCFKAVESEILRLVEHPRQ